MKYQVFDNDNPADRTGFPELTAECWANSTWDSFALGWLGLIYAPGKGVLKLGKRHYYSEDDYVVIRVVEVEE